MKEVRLLAIVVVGLACGEQPALLNEIEREPDTRRIPLTDEQLPLDLEQLPPVPPYPQAHRGSLVTQSAGEYDIHGAWETTAGLCANVGILEIYAGPSGLGTALAVHMPDGDPLGTYPLVAAQLEFPEAPSALVAVQVFQKPDAFGFQAYDGELELSSFGETVSGRFTATLREVNIDMVLHYVGVFEELPVEELPPEYCQTLQDSIMPTDSASVSDSAAREG